ncbi:unnamed protein product [Paramecium pentaurelia]|uniref:Transmembrane protein n=1 Tax=Paramecium pentaurelia TaxID=43138 RepID=A0A8S1UHX6_9CILI|nr:unnamed protein product [Paramecium pentaurelia]
MEHCIQECLNSLQFLIIILTNSSKIVVLTFIIIIKSFNQIHLVIYSLLIEGLQKAVQGQNTLFGTIFFLLFHHSYQFNFCLSLALPFYLPYRLFLCGFFQYSNFLYIQILHATAVKGIFVVIFAQIIIWLFKRINKIGFLNSYFYFQIKHHINDFYALASISLILMIGLFYDNE